MKDNKTRQGLLAVVIVVVILFLLISPTVTGCEDGSEVSATSSNYVQFNMEKIANDWIDNLYLYEDTETHIQYIVYMKGDTVAITPRYLKDDGTLYTAGGAEYGTH